MRYLTALFIIFSFTTSAFAGEFRLTSPQIKEGSTLSNRQVFAGFGCKGENISPALNWANAPKETKSFAVTLYDPDAPTGSGWWHWLIINIPPSATGLKENAGSITKGNAPKGTTQTKTDFGVAGFGGACPPAGDKAHRYIFTVFALNVEKLGLAVESSGALVGYNLNGHAIKKATLKAYYER